jgi:hypothetical protein
VDGFLRSRATLTIRSPHWCREKVMIPSSIAPPLSVQSPIDPPSQPESLHPTQFFCRLRQ